jgi:uncharacterized protein
VAALEPGGRHDLYWAARSTLISRPEDAPAFDHAFERYFAGSSAVGGSGGPAAPPEDDARAARDGPDVESDDAILAARWTGAAGQEEAVEVAALRVVASDAEVLRSQSFDRLTEDEERRVGALIRALAAAAPRRTTRRLRAAPRGSRFDMRRTLRRSLRTHGEPFDRAWRDRGTRLRPIVLLLDVSGSMAAFSRALLQFAYGALASGTKVEAFCFGTRLTRVTRLLRDGDPDRALDAVGREVRDWQGGTRIGESLKSLLDTWSQRAALRGAVVVLCSAGLERGDPDVLAAQMSRLSRLAHRLIWVNPLKGSPRYEPLARGMAAALPHVDTFLPGHNLESLEELAGTLSR